MSAPSILPIAIILGLLSAVGPFAIDMYLPAMPAIGRDLGTDPASVQLTLTTYFLAMGCGQLFSGPLSDMYGRKRPLYAGLILFALASVGCAQATDIATLLAFRFLQGLGAAAATSIPRAIVRDLHTGPEAARLMSMLLLVFSVSPILAPLVGSVLIAIGSWRSIFWAVGLVAVAAIAMVAIWLDETRPRDARLKSSLGSALASYGLLLRDGYFLGVVFIGSLGLLGFFVYLSSSSFVLIDHYGLSPTAFSIAFGVNAAAFFGAAQFNGRLSRRHGLKPLVRFGVLASAFFLTVLLAYHLAVRLGWVGDHLAVLLILNFLSSACLALVIPNTSVLALDRHGRIAGTASAVLGTLQMLCGAVGLAVISQFSDGRPLPMVIGMAAGTWLSLVLTAVTLGLRSRPPAEGAQSPSGAG